jgi:flavin-dependent dehydrogenase
MNRVDVLILGAGPAGAAAALTLRQLGHTVALVEASAGPRPRLGETLPAKALVLLERLGVATAFQQQGHLPVQAIRSAWGGPELHDHLAMFNPHGHGWHLDRVRFDTMLRDAAKEHGAIFWPHTRVTAFQRQTEYWQVACHSANGTTTVHARYLIDATGRSGYLARRVGRRVPALDCLVGVARRYPMTADNHEPWTLIEAVRDGWWYTAPLPNQECLAVFMTDADLLPPRQELEQYWPRWLATACHTHARIGGAMPKPEWQMQPAVSCYTAHEPTAGWLAIGDAALACDPLAGRGLATALETALAAAHALHGALVQAPHATQRYAHALETRWQDYQRQRMAVYAIETRWGDAPFWKRRHANAVVAL